MADRIEVDYAQLEKLGGLLVQRAETIEDQMNRLRQSMDGLRNAWKGEASDDFFAEFEDRAMPSMRRLYDVLNRTGQTLRQVSQTYRQSEEQAGNLFKGGGIGGNFGDGSVMPSGGIGGNFGDGSVMPSGGIGGNFGDGSVMPGGGIGGNFGDGSVMPGGIGGNFGDGSVMPGGGIGGNFGDGSVMPGGIGGNFGDGSVMPSGGAGGGIGGNFGDGSVMPSGSAGGGIGGGAGGGGTGGGGGASNFASDQLNFNGGAVTNGFNTIRDATNGLNAPNTGGNLDPLSGKVTGKGAMLGGVGGIGDLGNMTDFIKDFFNTNQAQLQDLVNSAQNAFSATLQAINGFADLVDTLF